MVPPAFTHAPCKLNLFLEILGKREDGYHELVTLMESITFMDVLAAERSDILEVSANRPDVPDGEANLAFRAVREAERWVGAPLPARIRIEKHVPPGSGLGGGSSDAAAALRAVLALHGRQLPEAELRAIAGGVGSDVPFFVSGGLARCTGRGEQVEPLDPGRERRHYVVVTGAPPAATAAVYGAVRVPAARRDPSELIRRLAAGDPAFEELLFNRLTEAAFERYPALAGVRDGIRAAADGRAVHLSGSGSAFFVVVPSPAEGSALAKRIAAATGLEARAVSSLVPGRRPA